jgi:hypothetical protein
VTTIRSEYASKEKLLEKLDDLIAIQTSSGNWDFDPYMHGMANGMILMRAIVSGEDPKFLDAPETWRSERTAADVSGRYHDGFEAGKLEATVLLRRADKMDDVDLKALAKTPKAWQLLMQRFPEDLVREFMVERPRPDYRDVEEISDWQLASPGPVTVQLAALLSDPENQRSVSKAPPDVVDDINEIWGTSILVGTQMDLNPGRYRAYAELPARSAKPSVLVDGVILFGVARFVAAALRGDRTLVVWDLRTTNPVSSRNRKGYVAVRLHGTVYPLRQT